MALAPPDLQTLLAQLLQEQQQNRAQYMGQQQSGYAKAGAALGMGLNRLFGGSDTEQAVRDPRYIAAQQQGQLMQGLGNDPAAWRARAAEIEGVDPGLAFQMLEQAVALEDAELDRRYKEAKTGRQETLAAVEAQVAPYTVRERIASATGKEWDSIRAESQASNEKALAKAREMAGSVGDSPNALRGAANRARGSDPMLAFHLEQMASMREQDLQADTEFERLIADLPKEEQARLKKARAETIGFGRQNITNRTLSPQEALAIQNNLDELNRARGLVQDIQNTIQSNPSAVGLAGTVRRGAQNITEAFDSVFSLLGTKGEPLMQFTESALNAAAEDVFESEDLRKSFVYDPDVARLKNLENSLIYVIARSRQPVGKLLASSVALAKQDASLTGFTGASSVNDRMQQIQNALTVASADLESARSLYASPEMIEALERNRKQPVPLSPTSQGAVPTPTLPDPSAIQAELERRKAAGQP